MPAVDLTRNVFRLATMQGSRTTLTKQAYAVIKEAILSLELKPGAPLVEEELAAQLGISKTPVRDALLELERDGLVVRIPYKGTYVSEITEQDAREIFELRAVLEGLAGRLATSSVTLGELDQAKTILDAYEKSLVTGDLAEASALGEKFHKLIYSRAPNQRLLAFLKVLDEQLRRLRFISNRESGRLQKSVAEHRKILSALRQGDPELVESALRDHHHSVLCDLAISNHNSR
jgi:DNA-binding GntR family transcriptional regulator